MVARVARLSLTTGRGLERKAQTASSVALMAVSRCLYMRPHCGDWPRWFPALVSLLGYANRVRRRRSLGPGHAGDKSYTRNMLTETANRAEN